MTSVAPAHEAVPHMTPTPDSATAPQPRAPVSAVKPGTARPRLRDQIVENPLLSLFGAALTLFGTALVALLLFALTSINDRIDGVEARLGERIDRLELRLGERMDRLEARMDRLEARMDRLEAKVDAGFAAQAAQIAELDARLSAQIAELDRKLTALVAHLNATEAVEAALEHRLLIPDAGATEPEGEPPG